MVMRKSRDHRFASDNLSAYLDGRLAERERRRVERHLAECEVCREDLATLRETVTLLRQVPSMPLPRSFTLPVSAQAEQTRFRRWNMAYGLLRGATVAVSFVLFLLLSSDALIGRGILPLMRSEPPREQVFEVALAPQTEVVVKEVEAVVEGAPLEKAAPPQMDARDKGEPVPAAAAVPEVKGVQAEMPAREAEATTVVVMAPKAESVTKAAGEKQEAEAAPRTLAESKPLPAPTTTPARGEAAPAKEAAATLGHRATKKARSRKSAPTGGGEVTPKSADVGEESTSRPVVPTATPMPSVTATLLPSAMATHTASAPTSTPSTTATSMPPPPSPTATLRAPVQTKVAMHITPQMQPKAVGTTQPLVEPVDPLWAVWRAARILSVMFVGLLLILLGGLIWVGHKRRV